MTTTIKQHINSLPLDERADFIKDYNELQTELKQLNNMTKVSVFGQHPAEQPKRLKKIEFVKRFKSDCTIEKSLTEPSSWDNVMLYRKSSMHDSFDMILAWDDNGEKAFYLGHWNDGIV